MSKMEPTSPSASSSSNEDIIYEDNYANGTKTKFQLSFLITLLMTLHSL